MCTCIGKSLKKIRNLFHWASILAEAGNAVINGLTLFQAIGLLIIPPAATIMRSINLYADLLSKVKIAPVRYNRPTQIIDTEQKICELEELAFNQFKNGRDVQKVIDELQAGGIDFETAFGIMVGVAVAYTMYKNGAQSFQPVYHYSPRIGKWCNLNLRML